MVITVGTELAQHVFGLEPRVTDRFVCANRLICFQIGLIVRLAQVTLSGAFCLAENLEALE